MESIDNSKMLIEAYFIGCLHGGNYKLDESKYTPIMKILDARINWVNKSLQSAILIDPYLFLYLSVASNENPGIAIIMLYTILQKLKEHGHDINGTMIGVYDLVEIYPDHLSVITTKISGINSGINRKMRMDIIELINLITGNCYSIKELFIIDYNINMNIIQKRKGESLWRPIRSTK